MKQKKLVDIKGTKDGLVLQMDRDHDFQEVHEALKGKLDQSGGFFKGAAIIGVDGRTLTLKEKSTIESLIAMQDGMTVNALDPYPLVQTSKSKNALNNPVISDTTDTSETPKVEKIEVPTVFEGLGEGMTKFHRGTLRSGMSVVFKGNVIVLGDVNPGAEVIADGNIVVMGHFRGVAHAGANGNDKAYVCANRLHPTQLRIGKLITRPPEDNSHPNIPEIAFVKDQQIVIEPYL